MPADGRWDVTSHTMILRILAETVPILLPNAFTQGIQTILIAAHTYDALDRPLSTYAYEVVRFLHIEGVRI